MEYIANQKYWLFYEESPLCREGTLRNHATYL